MAWKNYRDSLDHSGQRRDDNWFRDQDSTIYTLKMVARQECKEKNNLL